jgi:metal-dependent amidase/aminoacylase/carboxypeptidase family protein
MEDTYFLTERELGKIRDLRHILHAHPERSGQERETKRRLMDFLRENTSLQLADRGKWFSARFTPREGSALPPVAFRADMDALPVPETIDLPYGSTVPDTAHKCGHDGHSACLAALGLLLERDPHIRRTVVLIFQSAEETGKGGRACADFVREAGIGEVYAFHNLSGYPENAVMVRDTLSQCASRGLTFRFIGKKCHAGQPEDGRNPGPALARMETFAEQLAPGRENLSAVSRGNPSAGADRSASGGNEDAVRMITLIGMSIGSRDFGISPGEGEISFTLRAGREEEMAEMEASLRGKAEELCAIYGLSFTMSVADPFPATVNDPRCAEKVRAAASSLGLSVVPMENPWRPSEDFGWYLKACPGAIFYVGNGKTWPAPHEPEYDFNDRILGAAPAVFLKLAEGL